MHDFGSDDFVCVSDLIPGDLVCWFNSKRIALILSSALNASTDFSCHTVQWYKIHYVECERISKTPIYGCKELQSDHTVRLLTTYEENT